MKKFFNYLKTTYKENMTSSLLSIFFIISLLFNSTLLRIFTVNNPLDIGPLLADLAIILLITSVGFFFKPRKRIRYFMVVSILTTAICFANSLYYTYHESFVSISLIRTSTQVVNVGDTIVNDILSLRDFTYILQPIFIYFIHTILLKKNYYEKEIKQETKTKKHKVRDMALSGVFLFLVFCLTVTGTEWNRFGNQWNRVSVLSDFGMYTYHINDIVLSIRPKFNNLFGYDRAIKNTKDFYEEKNNQLPNNEYTNIFKGKNIIAIHAESIQTFLLDLTFNGEEVTPNLNQLADSGMYFSNFYAQVGVGNSSDSEFTLNTSILPPSSGTVFMNYFDREYLSIPKILKEEGYYSFSMHGNNGTFWNRDVMHPNLGYDMFYHKDYYEIDESIGFGLSDKSFFRQIVPMIKEVSETENKPFYTTLLMLSHHTPFDDTALFDEFPVDYKVEIDGEIVSRSYLEGTHLGLYIRSAHYADQAIGELMTYLEESGLLENSVLVIYGDHDARMPVEEFNIFYNYDPINDRMLTSDDPNYVEVDYFKYEYDKKVPLIIWSKEKLDDDTFNIEVEEPMGMYDVLPTVGNMFGFYSEYQLGHDIFSVSDNIVVFPNGNYLTKEGYYNSQTEEFSNPETDKKYIKEKANYATKVVQVSNDITNYDLIRKMKESE